MSVIIQLCMPVLGPLPPDADHRTLHAETLSELAGLRKIAPLSPNFAPASLNLELRERPEDEPLLIGKWKSKFRWRSYSLLTISVDAAQFIEELKISTDWDQGDFDEAAKNSLCRQIAVSNLAIEANYIFLAANISRPGTLSVVEGYVFIDGEQAGTTKPFFADGLYAAVSASRETGWPTLTFPTFNETWEWLVNSKTLVEGIGIGRLGRALSALSHLTSDSVLTSNSIELAWILLGLEALYSRGNVGLKEQLLGKTEAILGPRTENKKLFGAVYDFRSRLIHGDVDIPVRFTEFDGAEKYERFHAERYEHEALATAVLLATLQWMVKRGEFSLEFEYSIKKK